MRISEHCRIVAGLACFPPWTVNAGVVTGGRQTLVVDTGMSRQQGETVLGYAEAAGAGRPILAVNTERHLDHIGGNAAFTERGIEVLGHPDIARSDEDLQSMIDEIDAATSNRVRREIGEGRVMFFGTHIVNPTRTVDTPTVLDLGGLDALLFPTPGHTRTNQSVWIESDRVVFTGDCVVASYLPNLDEGSPIDWTIWLRSLAAIEELAPLVIVPGHGEVLRGPSITRELDRIRSVLAIAIETGVAPTKLTVDS